MTVNPHYLDPNIRFSTPLLDQYLRPLAGSERLAVTMTVNFSQDGDSVTTSIWRVNGEEITLLHSQTKDEVQVERFFSDFDSIVKFHIERCSQSAVQDLSKAQPALCQRVFWTLTLLPEKILGTPPEVIHFLDLEAEIGRRYTDLDNQ